MRRSTRCSSVPFAALVGALLLAAFGSVPRASAQSTPLIRPEDNALMVGALVEGLGALRNQDPDLAVKAFTELAKLNPQDPRAAHGLALAALAKGQVVKACAMIDQAVTLSASKPARPLVLNAAACHLAGNNRVRAIRVACDYLAAHPTTIDEPVLNALGAALEQSTPRERAGALFKQGVAAYEQANRRAEAARPGYRRFGMTWCKPADADKKLAAMNAAQKSLERLAQAVETEQDKVDRAQRESDRQEDLLRRKDPSAASYLARAQANLQVAQAAVEAAQAKYDEFAATAERPRFPEKVEPVAMDALTPPPLAALEEAAVAVAPPPSAAALPTETGPKRKNRRGQPEPEEAMVPAPGSTATPAPANPAPPKAKAPPAAPTRKMVHEGVAFAIAHDLLLTASAGIDPKATIQLQFADGQTFPATLVRTDDATGLALLRVGAGRRIPCLALADAFAGGDVTCVGYPDTDVFSPVVKGIPGRAAAPEAGQWTIALKRHPRLTGAPLLAAGGRVVGVCTAAPTADPGALKSVPLAAVKAFVGPDAADARPLAPGADVAGAMARVVVLR